jgi:hypothetical protein
MSHLGGNWRHTILWSSFISVLDSGKEIDEAGNQEGDNRDDRTGRDQIYLVESELKKTTTRWFQHVHGEQLGS